MSQDMKLEEIRGLLERNYYGHLGCVVREEMYIVPVTYAFRKDTLYGYTHPGKKYDMMRDNPNVCFQMEEVRRPQDWESVLCWGLFEEITEEHEQQNARLLIAEHFAKLRQTEANDPHFPLIEELNAHSEMPRPIVYKIKIIRMTGKKDDSGKK